MDSNAAHMFTEDEVEEMLGARIHEAAYETDQLRANLPTRKP